MRVRYGEIYMQPYFHRRLSFAQAVIIVECGPLYTVGLGSRTLYLILKSDAMPSTILDAVTPIAQLILQFYDRGKIECSLIYVCAQRSRLHGLHDATVGVRPCKIMVNR